MCFKLVQTDPEEGRARAGVLTTHHGVIETPIFMPVGTRASVKAVSPQELHELQTAIILGNTYHLCLRPGTTIIREAGGLHKFMGWDRPILTDSGGYQVFSLTKLRKITAAGVEFRSHIDGNKMFLGPKEAMQIQRDLGSDVAMAFDECTPYPCEYEAARKSLRLTEKWAEECLQQQRAEGQLYFGIVQGSTYQDLREEAARNLASMGFDGHAIGGLSVGEDERQMLQVIDWVEPLLPADKARYLMGVGTPPQIVEAVARGIDMFDCVLPTRVGRNGCAYTADGMLQVKAGRFKADFTPIEAGCGCYACSHFTKAYIRHLLNVDEILGLRLLTVHNLHFYLQLTRSLRSHIQAGTFQAFRREFMARYQPPKGKS